MGSRFTGDETGMLTALGEFKKHGLFFLDSLTTPKSAARKAARKTAIAYYERDIFLDNVKDVNAIIHQLKKRRTSPASRDTPSPSVTPTRRPSPPSSNGEEPCPRAYGFIPISSLSPQKLQ